MRTKLVLLGVVLTIALLACGLQPSTPSSSDSVATMVAATMQALTVETSSTLPRPVFYEGVDASGFLQVFRLNRDGTTTTQMTFEPADVDSYDVSPQDGSLAYISNNQLLLMNADGSGRRTLVDGGAHTVEEDGYYALYRVSSPRWSPDGLMIAFGHNGLNFYNLSTGTSSSALVNLVEYQAGFILPREVYSPEAFSPDGSKLLIDIGWYEGGTMGIYVLSGATLVHPSLEGILAGSASWTPDSSAVYIASPSVGMISSGLWCFHAADGSVAELIASQAPDGTFNFADAPLLTSNGELYFFFSNFPQPPSGHTPLWLTRANADGVTNRTSLLSTPFNFLNGALWAPDASMVIVVQPSDDNEWEGGAASLYFPDGRPAIPLLAEARFLRWGP